MLEEQEWEEESTIAKHQETRATNITQITLSLSQVANH
jgi:hypothetical protein